MAVQRHKGYNTVKLLIEGGHIKQFRDIFEYIPKTRVQEDIGINYARFNRIIKQIPGFTLDELYQLAKLIGIDEKIILDLAHSQYLADRKKK